MDIRGYNGTFSDLTTARAAENMVAEILQKCLPNYNFYNVGDNPRFYYTGDLLCVDKNNNNNYFLLEVKDDGTIGRTKNVLIEYHVWSYTKNQWLKANIESNYCWYCVLSRDTKTIYIMRWDILKQHYMEGRDMQKVHYNAFGEKVQKTYAKLLPLDKIREFGGLYWEVSFDEYNNPLTINNVSVA